MGTITLEQIHQDIIGLKKEMKYLKALIKEDFELSDSAKKELEEARGEPLSSYVDHKEVLKEFSE